MRLGTQGAQRHRAGDEALYDRLNALDLIERNRLGFGEFEKSAQRAEMPGLIVDEFRILLELRIVAGLNGLAEGGERGGRPEMLFAVFAETVDAAVRQERAPVPGRSRRAFASSAISASPMPPIRLAVPGRYSSMSSRERPTASNTCPER